MSEKHPFLDKYVLVRSVNAGVHVGFLQAVEGTNVFLRNSKRLWYWKAKQGRALSGVAQYGVTEESKIDSMNPEHQIMEVCEIITVSREAEATFRE